MAIMERLMRNRVLLFATLVILLLISASTCFTVDRTEYVYVTQFGRLVAIYNGATDWEAGLHWKWPWPIQTVQRLDNRLQVFDLPGAELLTFDPQGKTIDRTLTISAFVCWRIHAMKDAEMGVTRFIRTVGTPERAVAILGQRISSQLGAIIGRMRLEELVSVEPDDPRQRSNRRIDQLLASELTPAGRGLYDQAIKDYGIELVDIRLRRFNYPPQVREEIFSRIRSERQKKVAEYQSEGMQLSKNIQSQAEADARLIVADARAKEQRLKGLADAEAYRILNEAQSKDVAFYTFLKKLAGYQQFLGDNKTTLLLSSHRDLFDLLFKPPSPENGSPPPRSTAGATPPAKQGGQ
jgi:membrane protease subunit HflC